MHQWFLWKYWYKKVDQISHFDFFEKVVKAKEIFDSKRSDQVLQFDFFEKSRLGEENFWLKKVWSSFIFCLF
jgi:hypothetical protein